jgi:desulfoferrodoxin (superoxide reductase-like protein)
VENNRREYIERLQMVIRQLHGVDSTWEKSVPVVETFQGQTVRDGDVEVFKVNHPKTESAYAWSDSHGNFTAVLGIPPATDPRNAVKVSIVAAAKKGK